MSDLYQCAVCGRNNPGNKTYEYRGAYSCEGCFDKMIEARDRQRSDLIEREDARSRFANGLDVYSDSAIGKHNRKRFKHPLKALEKESAQMKEYEGRNN